MHRNLVFLFFYLLLMKHRPRRLRKNTIIRSMVQENSLAVSDLLVPLFIVEGENIKEEIPSMPGYFRFSLDRLTEELETLLSLQLHSLLLFTKVEDSEKDNTGKAALKDDALMQRSIRFIKSQYPIFQIFTDVALDPFSIYGHDGIVENGTISNDSTVEILAKMSVSHAQAGADFVAPSDMMDGRVSAIRKALDQAGFQEVGIMAYTAKFASAFYGPFREALDSAPVNQIEIPKDKKTYQMDFHNSQEAHREMLLDTEEGADILMVKPGMPYLDIVKELSESSILPIAVYQVSGEYAMIKAAAQNGWLDEKEVIYESLIAFKRAGAYIITTYFAKEIAQEII